MDSLKTPGGRARTASRGIELDYVRLIGLDKVRLGGQAYCKTSTYVKKIYFQIDHQT